MTILTSFVLFISLFFNFEAVLTISEHPKLLVISYDAFRYDYFQRNFTPYMNQLRTEGTYSDYMMNIFVTKTFPNHHTIATGLFAETHGVVGNKVEDPVSKKVIDYSYELYHYNKDILPIWTVNEKAGNGRHSGSMMWPGGFYEYNGTNATFSVNYNASIPWEDRVNTLMSWFTHPKTPINLGMLYIEEPDTHGHAFGINAPQFNEILKKLDNITKYIHTKLDQLNLGGVNVVHLSDHGMVSVKKEKIINLTNYIDDADYEIVETSPSLQIFPQPGKENVVYQKLVTAATETKHFTVYKKERIPQKYHFGNNPRIAPIFIVAQLGYAFQDLYTNIDYYEKDFNFTADNSSEFGVHGYDNADIEMHPFFFAQGPAFQNQYKLEPFNSTDLYPLFCEILGLQCPLSNGTLKYVQSCLTSYSNTDNRWPIVFIGISFILVLIATFYALMKVIPKWRCCETKANYKKLTSYSSDMEQHWAGSEEYLEN